MIPYAPAPFRPSYEPTPPRMGQKGTVAAMGAVPLLATTLVSGGIGFLGFRIGTREKGVLSVIGYIIGIVGGVGAVGGLAATAMWLLGVSLIPEPAPSPKPTAPAVPSTPALPGARFPEMPAFTGPSMTETAAMAGPSRFEGVTAEEFRKRSLLTGIPARALGLFH